MSPKTFTAAYRVIIFNDFEATLLKNTVYFEAKNLQFKILRWENGKRYESALENNMFLVFIQASLFFVQFVIKGFFLLGTHKLCLGLHK